MHSNGLHNCININLCFLVAFFRLYRTLSGFMLRHWCPGLEMREPVGRKQACFHFQMSWLKNISDEVLEAWITGWSEKGSDQCSVVCCRTLALRQGSLKGRGAEGWWRRQVSSGEIRAGWWLRNAGLTVRLNHLYEAAVIKACTNSRFIPQKILQLYQILCKRFFEVWGFLFQIVVGPIRVIWSLPQDVGVQSDRKVTHLFLTRVLFVKK
jgi:hypothetical protein